MVSLEKLINAVPRGCGYVGEKLAKGHPVAGKALGIGAGYALEVGIATFIALPVGIAVAVLSPGLYLAKKLNGEDKKY